MPFADAKVENAATGSEDRLRTDDLRRSFNSPFWPHVLATTSLGQEGLDFHVWCRQLLHWDLCSSPLDLEQREGRIQRFGGLSVRRALAEAERLRMNSDKMPLDEALGGRVPVKALIGYSSSFLNPGRLTASTNLVVSDGSTGSRSANPTNRTSLKACRSFLTMGGTNSHCAFLHGKARLMDLSGK